MDYLDMIQAAPAHGTALIENSVRYTYGGLALDALRLRRCLLVSEPPAPVLSPIRESSVYMQLVQFLARSGTRYIPVLLPPDMRLPDSLLSTAIAPGACMGVLTSGTTGIPKIWFRSFESWYDFFPTQNKVFHIDSGTRMFVHGNLAFTGSLNIYLSLLSAGACLITCAPVHPPAWNRAAMEHMANAVYLIPSKLRLLARTAPSPNHSVKEILSGSQSLGLGDIRQIKTSFPSSRCILYYGASELSYVTYLPDRDMTSDMTCVGTPFPGISVTIQQGEIAVDTPYSVLGIHGPYSVGDMGFFDERGHLHLLGRRDHVYNIHGRKVPAALTENALLSLDEVREAAVTVEQEALTAYVVLNPLKSTSDTAVSDTKAAALLLSKLKPLLDPWQLPRRIIFKKELPKNNSGKPVMNK